MAAAAAAAGDGLTSVAAQLVRLTFHNAADSSVQQRKATACRLASEQVKDRRPAALSAPSWFSQCSSEHHGRMQLHTGWLGGAGANLPGPSMQAAKASLQPACSPIASTATYRQAILISRRRGSAAGEGLAGAGPGRG